MTYVYCLRSRASIFAGEPEMAARIARSHASKAAPVLVTETPRTSWMGAVLATESPRTAVVGALL